MIVIVIASAAVLLAIMQFAYDKRTEHIKKQNQKLQDENKRVVDKHNDLVERFNNLRSTNKTYTDAIIERNTKIIQLTERIQILESGKQKTGVLEDFKRMHDLK